ncbi:MAG: thiamine pyrophosphate-dependent enzyme, partial [Candidatus Peregrinibacteria bacterium]
GQVSPTTAKGGKGPSTPHGVIEEPVNPLRLALSSGCSFVARGFSGDVAHLTEVVTEAIRHRGFSLVDVLQVCPSFNKVNTFGYYKERIYKLDGDRGDLSAAFEKAAAWAGQAGEWGDRIPIGVFYQAEKGVYEDEDVGLKSGAPVGADLGRIDVGEMMESFM